MGHFDNFVLLNQMCKNEIIHILESIEGSKDLVIEDCLVRLTDKIASMSVLQQHDVPRVQQLQEDRSIIWSDHLFQRVFIISSKVPVLKRISDYVKAEPNISFNIIFVPKMSLVCEKELESMGLFGIVKTFDLQIPFISIENDLYSMEYTTQALDPFSVAKAIVHIQSLYGIIPNTHSLGGGAIEVQKILKNYPKLFPEAMPNHHEESPFQSLFLFDRHCDLPSVLLSSSTYESLLHNTFGISCGKINFNTSLHEKLKNADNYKSKSVALTNADTIYAAVRNKHISQVFPYFSSEAKVIKTAFDNASAMNNVSNIKKFVSNELAALKTKHKQLELHISASELILEANKGIKERLHFEQALLQGNCDMELLMEYMTDLICQQTNPYQILLLMCLSCVCQSGGIASKHYSHLRMTFLRAYGYEYLPLLHSLQQNLLFYERSHVSLPSISPISSSLTSKLRPTLAAVSKTFNLTRTEENTSTSHTSFSNPSYVFSGAYTPLVVPLITELATCRTLPVDKLRKLYPAQHVLSQKPNDSNGASEADKPIIVYFLSGVTYAEVGAIRSLSIQLNIKIIIIATQIICRESFITQFSEHLLPTHPLPFQRS
uniref:Vacuolar protein sorting-associated protein 33A n=1 Tax=Rhabditophanes sp. KR3021 TaxID=114890 RepID=A0AC35TKE1_9BILA